MNRRNALRTTVLGGVGALAHGTATPQVQAQDFGSNTADSGSFKHSVSRWCYNDVPLAEFCQQVQTLGMHSIELTGPDEWVVMKEYGLTCAVGWDKYPEGVGLDNFYTNPDNHEPLEKYFRALIPKAKAAGVNNLICLAGQRQGRSDYENLVNCKKGIRRIIGMAEEYDITISMELLNSRVDHPDHQFDHMEWGVALCEMIGSDHFKILYDIYHAQVMEGDIVATIRKYADYISHYHTAGVPGRHEIDDTQELNYRFIMQAIKQTDYRGFIGQEFIPSGKNKEERLAALQQAVAICTV